MSGEINVISRTQHIIVEPASSSIAVINAGPPGPNTGIPGPPGVVQSISAGSGISVDSTNAAYPIVSVSTTAWVNVTLQNGWVLFTGYKCQYRKIGDIVYTRGRMSNGSKGATAFILPVGFRPPTTVDIFGGCYGGSWGFAHNEVSVNGDFIPYDGSGVTIWTIDGYFATTPV
ncbi:MAG: hypothetical protein ABWY25_07325 [Paenisporosarcina sp.]